MQYTLITGASAGIGKHFAEECASRNHNLVLVARNEAKLKALSDSLSKKFNIDIRIFPKDLTLKEAAIDIFNYCTENKVIVNFLINNAGLGFTNNFLDRKISFYESLVELNSVAPMKLIHLFAPTMQKQDAAYIINVSSMAGLAEIPHKSVYSASKHFLNSLSLCLYQEFKDTNLHISTLCPGGVPTNDAVKMRMKSYNGLKQASFIKPEILTKIAIDKTLKKQVLIVPGIINLLTYYFLKILPIKNRLTMTGNTVKQEL